MQLRQQKKELVVDGCKQRAKKVVDFALPHFEETHSTSLDFAVVVVVEVAELKYFVSDSSCLGV